MKSITLAIAIDQGEVLPTDIYDDKGPVRIDEYTIKNALNKYYGKVSLIDCIGFSINTCMTSVSKKLGRKLFYNELRRFGFGAITGIELDNELPGDLKPWRNWSDALLATAAYGQGVSATPLQMITAFAALANGGKLMHPTIIDEVRNSDGTVDVTQPHVIDQVIKPETAATMTAILVHSAATGYAKPGKVPGYRIAGKTGTSQIAGPGGRYEEGTGSTTATMPTVSTPVSIEEFSISSSSELKSFMAPVAIDRMLWL
jgi:cell division protein FtsI/penicillin-binding protein 2